MMAPWRSLIYRTVATPFSYSDDLALMLHMPPHTQNFDCNAPRILGDWMVSITSEPKPEVASEYGVETVGETALTTDRCWALDSTVQPYREVTKGHSGYKTAVAGTTDRLYKFHNSPVVPSDIVPTIEDRYPEIPSYYSFCPDRFDIFDPYVLSDPSKYSVPGDNNVYRDGKKVMPPDGVPNNAHWVVFDPTTVPGDWAPRRPDWYDVLVRDGKPAALASNANSGERAKWDFQALAVTVLSGDRTGGAGDGVHLTGALTTFAMTEFPMGLWKAKAGCNFSRVSTVAQYQAAKQVPTWMQSALDSKTLTGAEPVYAVPPGEMIHNLICSNCHGEQGDSSGRHATVLSEMTGGRATVTDLRNGMLNNDNLQRIFSAGPNDHSTSAEDWAARYFNWMALGGTNQNIPRSILAMVASTAVIGQVRPLDTPPVDANMLSSARNRCATLVPMKLEYLDSSQSMNQFSLMSRDQYGRYSFEGGMFEKANAVPQTSLVYGNGDAALWVRVCSIDNLPPVRAFSLVPGKEEPVFNIVSDLYPPESYPATAGVVNHLGQVVKAKDSGGIPSDNYFPWCIRMPANDSELQQADDWITQHTSNDGTKLPYCPELDNYQKPYIGRRSLGIVNDAHLNRDAVLLWTMRGAVNAGMLTYAYLRQLSNEDIVPTPTYDHCERISY
jgi:mono/diheme cytochrome c family protein